ncbi:hypothetical protein FH972_013203 [Carpinus fangiana]|uniref:Uncharacterized protein n=1 Tax=Carpinus fangiana TaxID=176857 RepID=A0A5N6R9F2_9ROSI|nr:hypothetical protein FH972_013203 [Carpinus fangiana]
MAFTSSSCCLNLSSPTPPSNPSLTPKTPQLAWKKNEGLWRRGCVVGMVCMVVIGSEMGDFVVGQTHTAIAQEHMSMAVDQSNTKWSDKRTCPAWRLNSLETIVPENLPRPSAHRRWEWVGYNSKNAPAVKVAALRTSTNCFSL